MISKANQLYFSLISYYIILVYTIIMSSGFASLLSCYRKFFSTMIATLSSSSYNKPLGLIDNNNQKRHRHNRSAQSPNHRALYYSRGLLQAFRFVYTTRQLCIGCQALQPEYKLFQKGRIFAQATVKSKFNMLIVPMLRSTEQPRSTFNQ